jgi:hypothetical protein
MILMKNNLKIGKEKNKMESELGLKSLKESIGFIYIHGIW